MAAQFSATKGLPGVRWRHGWRANTSLAGAGLAVDQHRQVAVLHPHRQAQALRDAWVQLRGIAARQRHAHRPARHAEADVQALLGNMARVLVGGGPQQVRSNTRRCAAAGARGVPAVAPRRRVQRLQAAVGVPGEQVVRLTVHVAGAEWARSAVATGAVHEEGVLDIAGALHRHLADQVLAAAVVRRFHGGHVQHPSNWPWGRTPALPSRSGR